MTESTRLLLHQHTQRPTSASSGVDSPIPPPSPAPSRSSSASFFSAVWIRIRRLDPVLSLLLRRRSESFIIDLVLKLLFHRRRLDIVYRRPNYHSELTAIGYDFDYESMMSTTVLFMEDYLMSYDRELKTRSCIEKSPVGSACQENYKVHAVKALSRLGLEDCFEGIICFETLNPTHKNTVSDHEDDSIVFVGSTAAATTNTNNNNNGTQIFDIIGHFAQTNPDSAILPKTPIVCKPYESAIERALKFANINPQKTLFFEDSVRNIQAGKRVGLHTVLVKIPL
ncbi:hypothetical protein EZV62_016457 [Acer yangbiense]|uniref:Uncharacterized protein n=1 Tax=Acer yangbiense TaxID=1000413 RepID=A0A5C7HPA4_9ROSI|nr:hypothetical protein EZV62_016457 [Acer yangbiense]